MSRYENKALRDLCRDRACIHCGIQNGTTVPAHRNAGKGMGIKNSDVWTIPLCFRCHSDYDQGKWGQDADVWFMKLLGDYHDDLFKEGAIQVTGTAQKREKGYQRPSKILPRCA